MEIYKKLTGEWNFDKKPKKKGFKALKSEIKSLKIELENKTNAFLAQKDLTTHYHELFDVGTNELRFKNMKVDYLKSVLEEIHSFCDDSLVKGFIDNAKEREILDTMVHTRKLFGKNPESFKRKK